MSFPAYPEYKNIGIEWLGRVPKHWQVAPLKRGYTVRLGKMLQTELKSVDDVKCNYLRAANIQWSGVDISDVRSMWLSPWERNQLRLQKGDLLVSEGGDVGRSAIWEDELHECYFQNSINRVRSRKYNHTKFLYYCISTIKSKGYIDIICNKSTISHFTAEKLSEIPVVFPPLEEQTAIAAFLDRETGTIDALIAEQEKLLTLLAEKRQATISHAVTRGLNPNAPMKYSGIAWLGEVPEHWKISPIKYLLLSMEQGWSPQCENFPVESDKEWGVMKVGCVNGGNFNAKENKTLPGNLIPISEYSLRKGDLLISRANTRELVGSAAVVPQTFDNLLLCDKLYRLRLNSGACLPEFLSAFLSSSLAREQIEHGATGASSSMLNIGQSTIRELKVPVPDVSEQEKIMDFIGIELQKVDLLKMNALSGIGLLKERRSALIAAAVTGKIDVRNAVPKGEAA